MTMTITFAGAAGGVTGSCYRVTHPGGSFLVDCGLFQGPKTLKALNYGDFPFAASDNEFVLLTHAHTDHCGLLPKLIKSGFSHSVFATKGTCDLLEFTLPDSGYVQEMEVETLNRRNLRRGHGAVEPIYTRADAEASLKHLHSCPYDTWVDAGRDIRARYWNAGHILGSASIEVEVPNGAPPGASRRILFSGDIGGRNKSFHPDPNGPTACDYLIVESTYGNRDRPQIDAEERRGQLLGEAKAALARGGNLLIPAFAVERTQELLLDLGMLIARHELPMIPVFLDSPLAIKATEVFLAHAGELEDIGDIGNPFSAPSLHLMRTAEQSRSINKINGGAIIIAGSGMCDAGRIRHHLKQNLWRHDATVLFVGYQAPGTLGNLLLSGVNSVKIQGEEVTVRATLRSMEAYSGHADRGDLIEWVHARLPVTGAIFITHGEPAASIALRDGLIGAGFAPDRIVIPSLDDCYMLSAGAPVKLEGTVRRLTSEKLPASDWHNDYAALTLDLRRRLDELPDAARQDLIARINRVLLQGAQDASGQ